MNTFEDLKNGDSLFTKEGKQCIVKEVTDSGFWAAWDERNATFFNKDGSLRGHQELGRQLYWQKPAQDIIPPERPKRKVTKTGMVNPHDIHAEDICINPLCIKIWYEVEE